MAVPPVGLPVGGFILASISAAAISAMPALAMKSSSDGTRPSMEVFEDAVLLELDIVRFL
jgi:hypothetical protein